MTIIDLHCHTSRYSSDSTLEPEVLVRELIARGIQGCAITEHNAVWSEDELSDLLRATGAEGRLRLWSGQEVHAHSRGEPLGDLLVFGVSEALPEGTDVDEIFARIREANGFAIAAHVGMPKGLREHAGDYPVQAIEVWNGRYGRRCERLSRRAASHLRITRTGGSDAHHRRQVGRVATDFVAGIDRIRTLSDLRENLAGGHCAPWKPRTGRRLLNWWENLTP